MICSKCNKEKNDNKFFKTRSSFTNKERIDTCNECIDTQIKNGGMDELLKFLRFVDTPFLNKIWFSDKVNENIGTYMKNIALNNKNDTYVNSDIEVKQISKLEVESNEEVPEDLVERFGPGYPLEEYKAFQKKYDFIKNGGYQENTTMHTEALIKYCIFQIKSENALGQNDLATAKEYAKFAKEAASAAKINPNQFKKEDLSNGIEAFGELSRVIEGAKDVIAVLPKFRERPQDKVDVTLWCYINYVRDLQGLEPVKYSEIYKFYDEIKKEYENAIITDEVKSGDL